MLRFLEIGLFLSPFVVYGVVLLTLRSGGPSIRVLCLTLAGLAVLGAGLAWFGVERGGGPRAAYVPARLQNGQVIEGRIVPP
jgi:hypothetical protein